MWTCQIQRLAIPSTRLCPTSTIGPVWTKRLCPVHPRPEERLDMSTTGACGLDCLNGYQSEEWMRKQKQGVANAISL
jgi:hypothetical protein